MDRSERNDDIQKLSETNYTTWSKEMAARLRKKGLWHVVNGEQSKPDPLETGYEGWLEDAEKAAGDIYLCLWLPCLCACAQEGKEAPPFPHPKMHYAWVSTRN
jgi:hypothetical protein